MRVTKEGLKGYDYQKETSGDEEATNERGTLKGPESGGERGKES